MGVFYVSGQKDRFTVGRDRGCDLVIDDPFISRCHLVLNKVTSDVASFDVVGTNGAVIRGQKVNKGYSGYLRFGEGIGICGNDIVWTGSPNPFCGMFIPAASKTGEVNITPIEIEGPPQRSVPEKPSIMLAAGPALTMAIPILLGAGRTVAVLSSVFAAVWAVSNVLARAAKRKNEESRRKNAYRTYLDECEKSIQVRQIEAKDALNALYMPAGGYFNPEGVSFLWKRHVSDGISARAGIGSISCPFEINIPREKFAVVDDSLKELPPQIQRKYAVLHGAPVLVDISGQQIVSFDAKTPAGIEMVNAFILQLATGYLPDELKITAYLSQKNVRRLGWITYLPHYSMTCEMPDSEHAIITVTDDAGHAIHAASKGYRVIMLTEKSGVLPGVVNIKDLVKRSRVKFDRVPEELAYSYASSLALLWLKRSAKSAVPDDVSFEDIIGITLSGDKVAEEYAKSDITANLLAPIGMMEGGKVLALDLHEKAAGPHGIIAGTTGSGKSELLTTLILSLAVKYPPDKLSFFLIDYKGGGMSNLFADLPHLAGSISNLSGFQSKRAMIALESENLRRQKLLADAGVNNINDYTALYDRGLTDEPLPHVIIVIDEFAQLRSKEPEFMDSLISVSQVGRSLGMHLILATQKPSGVVDDRIRSNSGFRIALRLVDKADSTDVIGTGDAALIDRCGRAYLQTALSGKTVSFQCAYAMGRAGCGADKIRIFKDAFCDKEIPISKEPGTYESMSTWFDLAMSAISEASDKGNYRKPHPLFLPPLPGNVSDDIAFAVFDDPYRQCYDRAAYVPEDMGCIFIVGKGATGKSTLLHTLIQRLDGKAFVYITDHGGGSLKEYESEAFCGGYADEDDTENTLRMALYIDDVIASRRRMKQAEPAIVYVLDGYDDLISAPELSDVILRILSNAKSAKVFVLAASKTFPGPRESRLFDTFFVMGCEDVYAVSSILKVPARTIPVTEDIPGRGIGIRCQRALEFQVVKPSRLPGKSPPVHAPHFPYVPAKPTVEDLFKAVNANHPPDEGLPVGFEERSGRVFYVPTGRTNLVLIAGRAYSGRHELLFNISLIAARYHLDTVSVDTYEALIASFRHPGRRKMIFTDDIGKILDDFYSNPKDQDEEDELASIFENPTCERSGFEHTVTFGVIENDVASRFAGRKIYGSIVKHPFVLWLGEGLLENRNFDCSYMSFEQIQKSQKPGNATILRYDEKTYFGSVIVPSKIIVDNLQSQ